MSCAAWRGSITTSLSTTVRPGAGHHSPALRKLTAGPPGSASAAEPGGCEQRLRHCTVLPSHRPPIAPSSHRTVLPSHPHPVAPSSRHTVLSLHPLPIAPSSHRTPLPTHSPPITQRLGEAGLTRCAAEHPWGVQSIPGVCSAPRGKERCGERHRPQRPFLSVPGNRAGSAGEHGQSNIIAVCRAGPCARLRHVWFCFLMNLVPRLNAET